MNKNNKNTQIVKETNNFNIILKINYLKSLRYLKEIFENNAKSVDLILLFILVNFFYIIV